MMVLVLISYNSLILLYFVTTFQDVKESQGGSREANSTKSPFHYFPFFTNHFTRNDLGELKQTEKELQEPL